MLEGRQHRYLSGTPMDGYEGVVGLPGQPSQILVAWALGWMARFITDEPERVADFNRLIEMAERRFPEQDWDWELLAARCEWPKWAGELVGDPTKLVRINYSGNQIVANLLGPLVDITLPKGLGVFSVSLESSVRRNAMDMLAGGIIRRPLASEGIRQASPRIMAVVTRVIRRAAQQDRSVRNLIERDYPHLLEPAA